MGLSTFPAPAAGLVKYSQLFTSSGTFTLPSGYSATNPLFVDVVVVGGGGGGGGGQGNSQGGGGGGSGCGFYYEQIPVYANTTVTIGTGGTGGTGQPSSGATSGTNGGSSLFGDLQAPGGGFGTDGGASTTTYGASLWTGTFYNSAVYLSVSSKAAGFARVGAGGPGGSAGANGEGATAAHIAGIFGGIASSNAINNSGGTYETIPFYSQNMAHSQGAVDGGAGYSSTQSGFLFANPGEGLNMSASLPSNAAAIGSAMYGFIGKKWWVPGGGGGGHTGASGYGGSAGTKTTPGKSGGNTGGSYTGQAATANTGGGGGGGGSSSGGTTGGNGGAGGSGYVLVTYYA